MNKEIYLKKGYHLEVTSWENDADNYRTQTIHCGTDRSVALGLLKMVSKLFASHHSDSAEGIGNMMYDDSSEATEKIIDYFENNNEILQAYNTYKENKLNLNDREAVLNSVISDFAYDTMGSSEWYCCRVFDKGVIMYTPEDIEVTIVAKEKNKMTELEKVLKELWEYKSKEAPTMQECLSALSKSEEEANITKWKELLNAFKEGKCDQWDLLIPPSNLNMKPTFVFRVKEK